jgi:DMSO/TMAO reductase YedYZ molybdopterin-dependent catalytic subunit
MGNARWTGVRLKEVLDRAGVKAGAVQVRFNGMDEPVVADAPDFMKSLDIDHARDGEVMIAYAMNGAQLPLLNGFPLRLSYPGGTRPIGSRCSTTSKCSASPMRTTG